MNKKDINKNNKIDERKKLQDDATRIYSPRKSDKDTILTSAIRETKKYMDESENKRRTYKENKKSPKKQATENPYKNKNTLRKLIRKKTVIIALITIIIALVTIAYTKTARWKKLINSMALQKNSIILDSEGNEIAQIGEQKKKIIKKGEQIPQNLKNAYVAIEDERFYKHIGIDLKRTAAAIGSYIIHFGKSSYGGSTITQQLVKNLTGENQGSIERKITEWARAIQTETFMSKEEILELYLNIIYTGPDIYGVGAGAQYYFSKDLENLSISECAFLAGINNSPNSYNPFSGENDALIKKRTKIVLDKMKELKFIDEQQWSTAKQDVENGLSFNKGEINSGNGVFSYHSDSVINECLNDIEKKFNIKETFATNYFEMAGLKIYGTSQPNTQKEVEAECEKSKYMITSNGENAQTAMVVIEPSTGQVVACVGGLGKKTKARTLNRATQSLRQTGSSIKPLAVIVPAISKNIVNPTTICDDTQRDFGNNYAPRDLAKSLGKITVRRAIESSQNIPFVEIMEKVTPNTAMDYLKKMGITSLTEEDCNLGLALGGQVRGITPLQMASAYNTIANDGEYIEPTFYTKIEDSNHNIIIKTSQKRRRVFSKSVAFVIKQLLTQPVQGTYGTATYCKINGVDVAAKTGTTDEDYDRWLCGFTPYYTATCWFGYDQNQTIKFNNRNPAGLIWANAMSRIHSGKPGKRFEMPSGMFDNVVSYRVCLESGKLARSNCEHTYTEYYLKNNVPGYCDIHGGNENSSVTSNTTSIKSTVNEIIQTITNEIDEIDPQEVEKRTQNNISPFGTEDSLKKEDKSNSTSNLTQTREEQPKNNETSENINNGMNIEQKNVGNKGTKNEDIQEDNKTSIAPTPKPTTITTPNPTPNPTTYDTETNRESEETEN